MCTCTNTYECIVSAYMVHARQMDSDERRTTARVERMAAWSRAGRLLGVLSTLLFGSDWTRIRRERERAVRPDNLQTYGQTQMRHTMPTSQAQAPAGDAAAYPPMCLYCWVIFSEANETESERQKPKHLPSTVSHC